jgi:transcriptional regulator with XRE-family HTH domain
MNKLKEIRIRQNISQEDLALKTGFTGATINRIETGKVKSPHFYTRKKLAQVLKVTVEELCFNGSE